MPDVTEIIVHKAPFSDWYATQDGSRGVLLCDRTGDEKVKVEPPPSGDSEGIGMSSRTAREYTSGRSSRRGLDPRMLESRFDQPVRPVLQQAEETARCQEP